MNRLMWLGMFFLAAFFASRAAVLRIGLQPVVPFSFVVLLALLAIPFAVVFEYVSTIRLRRSLCAALSLLIVVAFQTWYLWMLLAAAALAADGKRKREWRLLLVCTAVTVPGYMTLWNANYLLLHAFAKVLHDPALRSLDMEIYSGIAGHRVMYEGLFPLVRNGLLLLVFNNAYAVLFGEIMLAVLLICQTGNARRAFRFLLTLFGLYACGAAVFMLYPAAGPCLYFPASVAPGAGFLLRGMANDYAVTVTGKGTLSGFGYFVALPSLHVMVALFLQTFLGAYRRLFRIFLPVNVLLAASTIALGYHYVADVGAALVLAAPLCWWFYRTENRGYCETGMVA